MHLCAELVIAAAVAEEREECAKIAESMCQCSGARTSGTIACAPHWAKYRRINPACAVHDVADVIRARGAK
jgi:hypothetical protein